MKRPDVITCSSLVMCW